MATYIYTRTHTHIYIHAPIYVLLCRTASLSRVEEGVAPVVVIGDVTRSYRKHTLIDVAHRVEEGVAPVVVIVEVPSLDYGGVS